MKIGIDIDDTLIDGTKPLWKFLNKKLNINIKFEDLTYEKMADQLGITREREAELYEEFIESEYNEQTLPLEGAVEAIDQLSKNNNLVIVTNRAIKEYHGTHEMIKRYFKNHISEIYFGRNHLAEIAKKKSIVCRENNIELMIEDNRKNAIDCYENGIRVILFDYPWNRKPHPDGIIRVKNWKEVLDRI